MNEGDGIAPEGLIVMEKFLLVEFPTESFRRTVKKTVPELLAVPENTPLVLRLTPVGKGPEVDQL